MTTRTSDPTAGPDTTSDTNADTSADTDSLTGAGDAADTGPVEPAGTGTSASGTVPTGVATAPAPGVLRRLLPVELRKLVDTPSGVVLLLVGALLAGAFGGGQALFREDLGIGGIARMAGVPGAMLAPVLAALLVTAERSQRTALSTFALMPRRSAVLVAKGLAVVALGVSVTVLALLAALLIAPVGSLLIDRPVLWTVDWVGLGWFTLATVVAALSGYAIGLLVGNGPAAIVIVLVWPFLATTMSIVPELAQVLEWIDVGAVLALEDGEPSATVVARAVTGVAAWVVLPGVLGWLRTLRSEVR